MAWGVALASAGCGGQEIGSNPDLWTRALHAPSSTPGCFSNPPEVEIPHGTSDKYAKQQQDIAADNIIQATACIDRLRQIIAKMKESPEESSWSLRHRTSQGAITIEAHTETHPESDKGTFTILMKREQKGPTVGLDLDTCFQNRSDEYKILGYYTSHQTFVDEGFFSLFWNDHASVMVQQTPFGPMSVMYRGCDPDTGVSYGHLVNYDSNSEPKCWSDSGGFVSCEGTNTWPFVVTE